MTTVDSAASHGSVDSPQQSVMGAHTGSSVALFYSCNLAGSFRLSHLMLITVSVTSLLLGMAGIFVPLTLLLLAGYLQ